MQLFQLRRTHVTPRAYLKASRLECARRSLLESDRSTARIADIAYQWGFFNAGSFAAAYRQAFGELPSETLKALKFSTSY